MQLMACLSLVTLSKSCYREEGKIQLTYFVMTMMLRRLDKSV